MPSGDSWNLLKASSVCVDVLLSVLVVVEKIRALFFVNGRIFDIIVLSSLLW